MHFFASISSSGLGFQWKSRLIIKRSTLLASWSIWTMRLNLLGQAHEIMAEWYPWWYPWLLDIHERSFHICWISMRSWWYHSENSDKSWSHLGLAMFSWAAMGLWSQRTWKLPWHQKKGESSDTKAEQFAAWSRWEKNSANFEGSAATTSHGRAITNWNKGNWTPQLKELRGPETHNMFWKYLETLWRPWNAHSSCLLMTYDILWLISVPFIREQNEIWTRR